MEWLANLILFPLRVASTTKSERKEQVEKIVVALHIFQWQKILACSEYMFPALGAGLTFSRACQMLHVSRAWCRPHVFPRMLKVACFPRWRSSRSRRLHFLQFTVFQLRFLIGSMVISTFVLISDWLVTSVPFIDQMRPTWSMHGCSVKCDDNVRSL